MRILIGIDDTDVLGTKPGTGRLARDLAHDLANRGARLVAVLRHQLLVDPRIPYTSHNSPACVVLDLPCADGLDATFAATAHYVSERAALGADPGVCLVPEDAVGDAIVDWGLRAASEVVSKAEAVDLATACSLRWAELGGTGDGIIGALAAVGLTRHGDAGRYLELAGGLRDFGDSVAASALRARGITPISTSRNGEPIPANAVIATGGWLRPRMIGGRPVLFVEPGEGGRWSCSDRKNAKAHSPREAQSP